MKVLAILLLACVAVSQAAFTSSLVEQSKPLVAQAIFKVRLAARSRTDNGIQTQIVAALEQQVSQILSQIDEAVEAGQQIASTVVHQLANTYAQLQALGSSIIANGQAILSNLLQSLFGLSGLQGKFIGSIIDFVNNFSISDALGSLASVASNLISQIDIGTLLSLIAGQFIPQPIADLILNQLGLAKAQRGFFSDIWGSVSNGASTLWSEVVDVAGNIADVASGAFSNLQQFASQFATSAFTEASQITTQAAQEFLAFLRPYQQDLGSLYDSVAAQLGQIVGN